MTSFTDQQRAANCMGSFAHLLSGSAGRHPEFIDKVDIILSGAEPHAWQLLQLAPRVSKTRRPLLWVHYTEDYPAMPQIGLVAMHGGQTYVIENCALWMAPSGDRARLVPDDFKMGSFLFDDELRLQRLKKAPAKDVERAAPGILRAYNRLLDLQIEQYERGEVFSLPELHKAA